MARTSPCLDATGVWYNIRRMADFESLEKQIGELARVTSEGFKATSLRSDGLEKQINELADATAKGFQSVEERFDDVHKEMNVRFDSVDEKLGGVHRRIDEEVEQRHQLATHVSKLEEKIA